MRNPIHRALVASLAGVVLVLGGTTALQAQQANEIKRTLLLKHDASIAGHDGVVSTTLIPKGASEVRHTHPGDLLGYVLSGTLTLEIDGQPAATVKPGEAFFIPAEKVHRGVNKGGEAIHIVAVLYVEKGKPLAPPAP